ncbi:MAG: TetR family transcriptional regulator [Deltaproteobacteria bacterium]|nr:TetR family transcriptional regulator [Deltaproteobacteria bacterium]MBW2359313.1 TetR family transcriptional regulator [Deltaproteobacteria bacterium]
MNSRSTRGGAATRQRNAERSRAAILAAATAQFAANGLGGARVDEIARSAGVNKALLYHYFGNKQALFLAVLEATYAQIRGAEATLELEALSPSAAMERLVDFTWNYFVQHPEFITLVNSENLHRAAHLKRSKRVRALHHPLVERIGEVLERGAACGEFRAGVDPVQLYISIASLGYFYLSNAHTLGAVFERDLLSPREREARRLHVQEVVHGYLRPDASS